MNILSIPAPWYSTQFVAHSLTTFLLQNSYVISKTDEASCRHAEPVITASRGLSKEIIEIRGTLGTGLISSCVPLAELCKSGEGNGPILLHKLLLPFSQLTARYSEGQHRCVCLPDLSVFRDLLQRLDAYFTPNQLQLKIYLVNQTGQVSVLVLNPHKQRCRFYKLRYGIRAFGV